MTRHRAAIAREVIGQHGGRAVTATDQHRRGGAVQRGTGARGEVDRRIDTGFVLRQRVRPAGVDALGRRIAAVRAAGSAQKHQRIAMAGDVPGNVWSIGHRRILAQSWLVSP
jgi:hypothetical protein